MDIQMVICLVFVYVCFIAMAYSKKSSGETSVSATPDTDCGYIIYFPDEGVDDDEELIKDSSSSSESVQTEPDWSMFTDAEFVLAFHCEMVYPETTPVALAVLPDPWDNEAEVVPASMELEFNQCQLEYQLALPPAVEGEDVVVAEVEDTESYVGWAHQDEFDLMMAMSIRQLKTMAKELHVPKYGSLCKENLAYKILSWKDCGCGQDILTRLFNIERTEGCVSDNDLVEQCNINGIDFVKTAIKGTKFSKHGVAWSFQMAQRN